MTIVSKFITVKALFVPQESSGSMTEKDRLWQLEFAAACTEKKI